MQIAKHQSLPVGRVLIMSGFLSDGQLRAAVQASVPAERRCHQPRNRPASSFRSSAKTRWLSRTPSGSSVWRFNKASPQTSWANYSWKRSWSQEKLWIRHYSSRQLAGCRLDASSFSQGQSVEPLLSSALNAQVLVRDHKITREQALQGLQAARDRQIPLEQSLAETRHAPAVLQHNPTGRAAGKSRNYAGYQPDGLC